MVFCDVVGASQVRSMNTVEEFRALLGDAVGDEQVEPSKELVQAKVSTQPASKRMRVKGHFKELQ